MGELTILHKAFTHARGLVYLGRLDGGAEPMRSPGPLKVTISLVAPEATDAGLKRR